MESPIEPIKPIKPEPRIKLRVQKAMHPLSKAAAATLDTFRKWHYPGRKIQ